MSHFRALWRTVWTRMRFLRNWCPLLCLCLNFWLKTPSLLTRLSTSLPSFPKQRMTLKGMIYFGEVSVVWRVSILMEKNLVPHQILSLHLMSSLLHAFLSTWTTWPSPMNWGRQIQ
jgi:hypothetical protein